MNSNESLKDLAFPLNIYARLVEMEAGRVDYIHYGMFNSDVDMTAAQAQRRASDILYRHLPHPCKLLEVGIGLGTTLNYLVGAGFSATGITPDAAQITFAKSRHGGQLPAVCSRFEDFDEAKGTWDAILFQESSQYISGADLFAQADILLKSEGDIVVMDEFLLRSDNPGPEGLHNLEQFIATAQQHGFLVSARLELSAQAAPTVDWLLQHVTRYAAVLKAEFGVDEQQLAALNASNRAYQAKYADGRYGYFLLRLTRQAQA